MAERFLLRRDSTANWATANPVLALGEPGYDETAQRLKMGDGVTAWATLPYVTNSVGAVSSVNGHSGVVTLAASDVGADPAGAAAAVLPAQTGQSGKFLTTDGSAPSWVPAGSLVSDASPTAKGIVQLAGDLAGTAAAPTVAKIGGVAPATVATTGAYTDLSGKPTIPTVGAAGAGAAVALSSTDASVTNSRTPTAHAASHATGGSDPVTAASIGGTPILTPTATKTAAYTAAAGDLAMMNVPAGATVLTLPTAPANKSQVGYRAIGATTAVPLTVNRGGSTDTIGTTGATSATVPLADEVAVLQYDAPNTRWLAVSNVKTQASLDAAYLKPIYDEGSLLTQRQAINFVGTGVTATDDSGNSRTVVTVTGAALGGAVPIVGSFLTAVISVNTQARAVGTMDLIPVTPLRDCTVDALALNVTTAQTGGLVRLGIYASDPVTRLPAALISEFGTVAADTTGQKLVVGASAASLKAGLTYYLAALCEHTGTPPSFTTVNHTQPGISGFPQAVAAPTTTFRCGFSLAAAAGSLPASAATAVPDTKLIASMARVAS